MRPDKLTYYLNIAKEVATRATCLRRKYGAVIVKDDIIVSTGYCGAPRNTVNCCDIGFCMREKMKIPSGQRYELCRSVHGEMNAIIAAGFSKTKGSDLYLTGIDSKTSEIFEDTIPCELCKRVIINAGIINVNILRQTGIYTFKVSDWVNDINLFNVDNL